MDSNDRQAIDGLFSRIAEVERQSGPLDQEANAFIGQKIAAQPTAPYLMAQTIVMQEQALAKAEQRIQDLERQPSSRSSGGLFSSLFGGGSPAAPASRAAPAAAYGQQAAQQGGYGQTTGTAMGQPPAGQPNSPWGNQGAAQQGQRSGGGFLQGAAQTAMGVAGGMLLGSAIGSMFSGGEANAAETPAEPEAPADDVGADMGDDMGDMDF